jgi:uncharacterized cupredoxin-like copper-binding protein
VKRRLLVVALVIGAIAVAVPIALAANVGVTGKEFKFSLTTKTVRHGKVTFRFTNKGRLKHDFKIAGKKTSLIKPGKSATLTVSLKKGKYTYICTVPGHAAAGMKGTLKVN